MTTLSVTVQWSRVPNPEERVDFVSLSGLIEPFECVFPDRGTVDVPPAQVHRIVGSKFWVIDSTMTSIGEGEVGDW